MTAAIRVQGLAKKYDLRGPLGYATLAGTLTSLVKGRKRSRPRSELWALDDVSFDVAPGEAVGVIGRNGAGKSSLLKILSRITPPTRGRVELRGRVASLLEVGTGFHPDLTARENVMLNGVILGMTRKEMARRFDAIIDFADLARFTEEPIKHLSSGMTMRLAFSVAAHLDAEILLVDEVLAVGDAEFQRKCLAKMSDIAQSNRTLLFVSHEMGAIERLCKRAIVLEKGKVAFAGDARTAIEHYLAQLKASGTTWVPEHVDTGKPHFVRAFLCQENGEPCTMPTSAGRFGLQIEVMVPEGFPSVYCGVVISNRSQQPLFMTSPLDSGIEVNRPGRHLLRVMFPEALFMPRQFHVGFLLYAHSDPFQQEFQALQIDVAERASLANSLPTGRYGELQILCDWRRVS